MTTLTLTKIKAYDHFSSEDNKGKHPKHCIIYYTGELLEEDKLYLTLRTEYSLFKMEDGTFTKERHEHLLRVLKNNIIKREDTTMEWDENNE